MIFGFGGSFLSEVKVRLVRFGACTDGFLLCKSVITRYRSAGIIVQIFMKYVFFTYVVVDSMFCTKVIKVSSSIYLTHKYFK